MVSPIVCDCDTIVSRHLTFFSVSRRDIYPGKNRTLESFLLLQLLLVDLSNLIFYISKVKGIVQPFELKCVTRLIRSAVKNWRSGNFLKSFLMTQSHERSIKPFTAA